MTERSTPGTNGQRAAACRPAVLLAAGAVLAGAFLTGCGPGRKTPPVPEQMPSIVAEPPAEPMVADEGLPGRWERIDAVSPAGRLFFVGPGDAPRGGLLLVHGAWGVNADVRALARDLSDHGFAVVVPDVFDGLEITTRLAQKEALAGVASTRANELLAASEARLRDEPGLADARIGILSLASGAVWAMHYAERSEGIGALVVDDALLLDEAAPHGPGKFATLLLVGELDRSIDARRLEQIRQAFEDVGARLEIARIPGAGTDLLDPRAFGFSDALRPRALETALAFFEANLGAGRD